VEKKRRKKTRPKRALSDVKGGSLDLVTAASEYCVYRGTERMINRV